MGFFPTEIIRRDAGHALFALVCAGLLHLAAHDKHRGFQARRHHMITYRHAPRDLQVDQLMACTGVGHQRLHQAARHLQPLCVRKRAGHAHRRQRALQARPVLLEAENAAAVRGEHFVDAIAKDEVPVQHAHPGVAQRAVHAIEITQALGEDGRIGQIRQVHGGDYRPRGSHANNTSRGLTSTWGYYV